MERQAPYYTSGSQPNIPPQQHGYQQQPQQQFGAGPGMGQPMGMAQPAAPLYAMSGPQPHGLSSYAPHQRPPQPQQQQYAPPQATVPRSATQPAPWQQAQQQPQYNQQYNPQTPAAVQQQQQGQQQYATGPQGRTPAAAAAPWAVPAAQQAQQACLGPPAGAYSQPQQPLMPAQQYMQQQQQQQPAGLASPTHGDAGGADSRPRPTRGHYSSKPVSNKEEAPAQQQAQQAQQMIPGLAPTGVPSGGQSPLAASDGSLTGTAGLPPSLGAAAPAAAAQHGGQPAPPQQLQAQQQGVHASYAGGPSYGATTVEGSYLPPAAQHTQGAGAALPETGAATAAQHPARPGGVPGPAGPGDSAAGAAPKTERAPLILEDRFLAPVAGIKRVYESLGFSDAELHVGDGKRRDMGPAVDTRDGSLPKGKDTVYRMILNLNDTALLIGKGGGTVRQIERETGARVKRLQEPPGCSEQVVVVWSSPQPGEAAERLNNAQKALMDCSRRVLLAANPHSVAGAGGKVAMLINRTQELAVVGRGGSTINRIRSESGAAVKLLLPHQLPPCALANDLLIEIEGAAPAMLKAIELISAVLRDCPASEMPSGAPASFRALAQGVGAPSAAPGGAAPRGPGLPAWGGAAGPGPAGALPPGMEGPGFGRPMGQVPQGTMMMGPQGMMMGSQGMVPPQQGMHPPGPGGMGPYGSPGPMHGGMLGPPGGLVGPPQGGMMGAAQGGFAPPAMPGFGGQQPRPGFGPGGFGGMAPGGPQW